MCRPVYTAIRQSIRTKVIAMRKDRKNFCMVAIKLTPADSVNFYRSKAKRYKT